MKRSLQAKKRSVIKHSYIILVELEYIISLVVAYFLGAEYYSLSVFLLIVSILMGYGTSYLYWWLIEHNNENKID